MRWSRRRLGIRAGLWTTVQGSTRVGNAVQDKSGVHDPDGAPWEVYTVPCRCTCAHRVERRRQLLHERRLKRLPGVLLRRRLLAEFLGSAFLGAVVVGSGIAAQRLSPGDIGLELFENAAATAAGLFTIILMFGAVSGGHFNPIVSFVDAALGGLSWRVAVAYLPAQVSGCVGGAVLANFGCSLARSHPLGSQPCL